ncbi:hypothetical protein HANVADRAFT_4013 [Hanseniaspora valbyensis NRRL Y-1626]|uniref:N-acetyltransferase domain-containing protein n=1 Tax=Hanseniaspora valbyensis NRRL Y-1626 TaxID=766949 RepID=A0A1B7T8Z2_9ASCO|nr:hypothetical protein HANVADRAFT_4013 [Hanseniaspora valbyensis NRRL Y-1626]
MSKQVNYTDDIERAAKTLDKAFLNSPSNDYLMKKFMNIPLDQPCSKKRIKSVLEYFCAFYHDNGGEIAEVDDFNTVAVYATPENHIDQWMTNDEVFNQIFFHDLHALYDKYIPENIEYYYLFIVGRDLTDTTKGKGNLRAIFEAYKKRADESNSCIVLEAISEEAKSVYEYFGFKTYSKFTYGQNEVNRKGELDPNGEGFDAYLMIYHKDTIPGFIEI